MERIHPEDLPPRFGDHPYPPQFPPMLDDLSILCEITYYLFIICMCLVIYFKTKEIYELTGHSGLHYFRYFFIFFALSSAFRLVSFATLFNFSLKTLNDAIFLDKICIFAMLYFGTIAFISLALSILARNHDIDGRSRRITDAVLYSGSAVIVLPFLAMRMEIILIAILSVFFAAVMLYDLIREYRSNNRIFTRNRITNILLFIFWILNVQFYAKGLLPRGWFLPLMLVSAIIFLSIFLRLNKIYRIDSGRIDMASDYPMNAESFDSEISEEYEETEESDESDINAESEDNETGDECAENEENNENEAIKRS